MTTILVVIPTYNEIGNITRLIQSVRGVLTGSGYNYHILVVDDNSPDGTGEAVEEAGRLDERIRLLKRSGKLGLGSAYVDGFTWALHNLQFDILVQMDADFSHPPPDIVRLVEAVVKGSDVVIASRYVEGGASSGWSLHRRLISRGANLLTRILLGVGVRDVTSGFRAMSRRAVQELLKYRLSSRGYSYQVECVVVFEDLGLRIEEVLYTFMPRLSGKAKLSFGEIVRFAAFLVKSSFSGVKRRGG